MITLPHLLTATAFAIIAWAIFKILLTRSNMEKLLSVKAVCSVLDMHRATLYRKIKAGEIPQPMKDGPRSKWKESDIQPYIERLSNQRAA